MGTSKETKPRYIFTDDITGSRSLKFTHRLDSVMYTNKDTVQTCQVVLRAWVTIPLDGKDKGEQSTTFSVAVYLSSSVEAEFHQEFKDFDDAQERYKDLVNEYKPEEK